MNFLFGLLRKKSVPVTVRVCSVFHHKALEQKPMTIFKGS